MENNLWRARYLFDTWRAPSSAAGPTTPVGRALAARAAGRTPDVLADDPVARAVACEAMLDRYARAAELDPRLPALLAELAERGDPLAAHAVHRASGYGVGAGDAPVLDESPVGPGWLGLLADGLRGSTDERVEDAWVDAWLSADGR